MNTAFLEEPFTPRPLTGVDVSRTLAAAPAIKRRGPSLTRRFGQQGNVYQKNSKTWNPKAYAYGRYWEDVPSGPRRRASVSLGICGTKSEAKRKLRAYL